VSPRRRAGPALLAPVLLAACAASEPAYVHSRFDYAAFRARVGALPEPNYLPFVAHRVRLPDGATGLVLCRFPDAAFPLAYHVEGPAIPVEMQDEFQPREPGEYARAIEHAFELWREAIGGVVRFERVDAPERAAVRVRLRAELHEAGEGLVGGIAGSGDAPCEIEGAGDAADRVESRWKMHELQLFIADSLGLLTPRQVEHIALHEIGHLLGASGQHSPLRGDVMFRMTDDRRIEVLSAHDRNTFRALHALPPGTVYARAGEPGEHPPASARRAPPRLDVAIADERFGFELQLPVGWERIRTPRGWIAVDGVSWDYDASVQVIAVRGAPEAYAAQQSLAYEARGGVTERETFELDGERVAHLSSVDERIGEATYVVGWGEGWALLIVADSRAEDWELYEPWFHRVLLSLRPLAGGPAGDGRRRGRPAPRTPATGLLPPGSPDE
jgi:hypothetical protein